MYFARAEKMALCVHEDLGSDPSTHVKRKVCWNEPAKPALEDHQSLLAS